MLRKFHETHRPSLACVHTRHVNIYARKYQIQSHTLTIAAVTFVRFIVNSIVKSIFLNFELDAVQSLHLHDLVVGAYLLCDFFLCGKNRKMYM